MFGKTIGSGRRILTFPAVRPCESISAITLLNSLIGLARDICHFKSKTVSTNKRNAHEAFRHISNLLVFFEELRSGPSSGRLPDRAIVSLSELHLIVQKLKYLLEDCTLDGARLWIVMNSDRISGLFRALIRAISKSLDVFPLGSVNLPGEVIELVDLVVRQSRKARIGLDPEDERVVNEVNRILSQFENGVIPDPDKIIRVLDHIGVGKWSECNKEIKFLEAEMEMEQLNEKEKNTETGELTLLSSLVGFMTYCRCVIFRSIDTNPNNYNENGDSNLPRGLNPEDLRCPISLEIMTDPVTLSTGHTYDRSSILKWFKSGNPICPKTGEKLINMELVPNTAIKRLIQQYCAHNGLVLPETGGKRSRDATTTAQTRSLAAEEAVKLVAAFLANEILLNSGDERIGKAVYEARVLTKTSGFNRSCLVEAGVVAPLLKLLRSNNTVSQDNTMAVLLNLSKHDGGKDKIVENGGVGFIVEVLNKGVTIGAKQNAAAAIFYLAAVENYSLMIGETHDAIQGLMDLIKGNTGNNSFARRNALIAVLGLLTTQDNHWRVLAAGAVPLLLDLLKTADPDDTSADALAVLAKLAEAPDGTIAVIRRGGLSLAVRILSSPAVSRAAKHQCVALLLNLCSNAGGDVVGALVKSPTLMGSLYSVVSDGGSGGGSGGSKKASALIRILHEFHERRSGSDSTASGSVAPVLPRERFVHAW